MPRDDPAANLTTCAGCAASWPEAVRARCRVCHVTFDDDLLLDVHPARRVLRAFPPSWAGRRGRCVVSIAGREPTAAS
ncbi:MAG TPA: hypothetical protein VE155_13800 [Pseudonocardiaceae bacterium]|nr:hypothetical protein [Pseudonocardiaceae bacterium]